MKSSIKVDLGIDNVPVLKVKLFHPAEDVRDQLAQQLFSSKNTPFLLCCPIGGSGKDGEYSELKVACIATKQELDEILNFVYPVPEKVKDDRIRVDKNVLQKAISFIELFKGNAEELKLALQNA